MPSVKPRRPEAITASARSGGPAEVDHDLSETGIQSAEDVKQKEGEAQRKMSPGAAAALAAMTAVGAGGANLPDGAALQNLNPTPIVRTAEPEKSTAKLDLEGSVPSITLDQDQFDLKLSTAREDSQAFDYQEGLGEEDYAAFVGMKTPAAAETAWPEFEKIPDIITIGADGRPEIRVPELERESMLGLQYGGVLAGVRKYAESHPEKLHSRNLDRVLDQDFPAPVMD